MVEELLRRGEAPLTDRHLGRLLVGGVASAAEPLRVGSMREAGTAGLLGRREPAAAGIGGGGTVIDGRAAYPLAHREAPSAGMGAGTPSSASVGAMAAPPSSSALRRTSPALPPTPGRPWLAR
jgi:4-deoxy-L-threo-5-hexosulose-uronate ketol-isomerase